MPEIISGIGKILQLMLQGLSTIPPVCLFVSLCRILTGKLKYCKKYLGQSVVMEDGSNFTIFREIIRFPVYHSCDECVFIVRFKFKHLSHKVNQVVSKIPMLLITGQPGFVAKYYAVNHQNGWWQGMYQWKSVKDLEAYKKSFVYRMMNKRAIPETIDFSEFPNQHLDEYIENRLNM